MPCFFLFCSLAPLPFCILSTRPQICAGNSNTAGIAQARSSLVRTAPCEGDQPNEKLVVDLGTHLHKQMTHSGSWRERPLVAEDAARERPLVVEEAVRERPLVVEEAVRERPLVVEETVRERPLGLKMLGGRGPWWQKKL